MVDEAALPDLAIVLRGAREGNGLSLRDVEKRTGGSIKNSYLCHLENGRIDKPSVDTLWELSEIYDLDYGELMGIAGYHVPNGAVDADPLGSAGVLLNAQLAKLNETELADILNYVEVVKKRRLSTGS